MALGIIVCNAFINGAVGIYRGLCGLGKDVDLSV
jgi:hypothetical protein